MPIDPNIALKVEPFKLNDPMETYTKMLSLKNLIQTNKQNEQLFPLKLQEAQDTAAAQNLKMTAMQQQQAEQKIVQEEYIKAGGDLDKLFKVLPAKVSPTTLATTQKAFADSQEALLKMDTQKRAAAVAVSQRLGEIANSMSDPTSYAEGIQQAFDEGLIDEAAKAKDLKRGYDSRFIESIKAKARTVQQMDEKNRADIKQQQETKEHEAKLPGMVAESTIKTTEAAQGGKAETKPVTIKVPGNPKPQEGVLRTLPNGTSKMFLGGKEVTDYEVYERPQTTNYLGQSDDPKAIAQGVISGDIPPDLKGFYRLKGPIVGELQRQGFSQTKAMTEWNAVQRWITTANGTQQLRLRQAIEKIDPHVEYIRAMYEEWQKTGLPSGYQTFNSMALAAAAALPGKAGELANRLQAQINDLTAELGNVYMGGNTPTDHALELAGANLKTKWNERTFLGALDDITNNTAMRRNAIRFTGPTGVATESPYMPQDIEAHLKAGGGGAIANPPAPTTKAAALHKVGDVVTVKDGRKIKITWVNQQTGKFGGEEQ